MADSGDSNASKANHENTHLCIARGQLSSIAEFLIKFGTIEQPETPLIIESPSGATLEVLSEAMDPWHSHT